MPNLALFFSVGLLLDNAFKCFSILFQYIMNDNTDLLDANAKIQRDKGKIEQDSLSLCILV